VSRLQCSRSSPRAPRCSRVSWRAGSALANSRPPSPAAHRRYCRCPSLRPGLFPSSAARAHASATAVAARVVA
jgi:hypothetical protein